MKCKGELIFFISFFTPISGQILYRIVFDIITYIQDQFKGSNIIQNEREKKTKKSIVQSNRNGDCVT